MVWNTISLLAIILSIISIVLSCVAVSIFVGLKNSTHKIEYMPVPTPGADMQFDPKDVEDIIGSEKELEKRLKEQAKLNPLVKGFEKFYEE